LTKNSKETAFFILQFAQKMKRNEKDEKKKIITNTHILIESKSEIETETTTEIESNPKSESSTYEIKETYENTQGVIQTKKNKNITKDNISVFMLCQIPGISTTTSGLLLQKYGHISNLIMAIKQNPNEMNDFRHNDKKLNKNIITNLNEYLK
jgi:hypothetical protein